MRKIILLLALSLSSFCMVFSQNAVLHISLAHCKATSCYVNILSEPNNSFFPLALKDNKTASSAIKLTKPGFVNVNCHNTDTGPRKYFNYLFYLSPGDDLEMTADFNEQDFRIKVSGKGSNNNQPLMSAAERIDLSGYYRDTLPYRVMKAINIAQRTEQRNLNKYIKLYKPTPSYINDWRMSLRYYASDLYDNFKGSNKNYVWDAYYRNYVQWQKITDSLFRAAPLNNDAALSTYHYDELISGFLFNEKVHLSDEEYLHPVAFYREWYHTDTVEGKKLFKADRKNVPGEKIINKYFTGRTAEYLYAVLLAGAANESNPTNIPEIFGHFKKKYPRSEYIGQFGKAVDIIIAKQKHTLNRNIVFMVDNGTKFNSLDELLVAMKGKTVLVDMWGTWCGPCREEIEKNSFAIREHFKNKGLTYLYIANDDLGNQDKWKKLVAYFTLEGTHLLANKKLTEDIMAKVKGTGYPTLFTIKKDGSFELSKTAYPIERDILFKQLEADLAL